MKTASPLAGIKRPSRGNNPKRPVASWERFEATRKATCELAADAKDDSARRKWVRLEMAVVLAEATGRRIGSIRQLEWSDVDLERSRIRWRAEADKERKEWSVPIPPALRDELRSFRVKLGGAFGGLLFPSESDVKVATRSDVLSGLLLDAEPREASEARRLTVACLPPQMGNRTKAPALEGRRRRWRME